MSTERITIVCGDEFHEAGPLTLYTFVYERGGRFFREGWTDETIYFPDKREPNVARSRPSPAISLDKHDQPQTAEDDEPMGRERYNLRCGDQNIGCGTAVVVRRENLDPILDVLARHGIESITLQALHARLSST